jgi:hypothetical protein
MPSLPKQRKWEYNYNPQRQPLPQVGQPLPLDRIRFISKKFVYTFVFALIMMHKISRQRCIMFVNDNHFIEWMERLSKKLTEIGKDLKSLANTNDVFDKEDKLLDNQDLCLMLHISSRTLQRYRSDGILPFLKRGQKIYYKTSDVREFIYRNGDYWDKKRFDNGTKTDKN